MENRMEFPQKAKNGTTLPSSSSSTRYLPKSMESSILKPSLATHVQSQRYCTSQEVEAGHVSIDR